MNRRTVRRPPLGERQSERERERERRRGRWVRQNSKPLVEAQAAVAARSLRREDLLRLGQPLRLPLQPPAEAPATAAGSLPATVLAVSFELGTLQLTYRAAGAATAVVSTVRVTATPCRYGGHRYWFRCPGVVADTGAPCQRRVAKLYLGAHGFFCRQCLGLVYRSQRATPLEQASRRLHALRQRLGVDANLLQGTPVLTKPKGIQWRTYRRLQQAHRLAELEWGMAVVAELQPIATELARRGRDVAAPSLWPEPPAELAGPPRPLAKRKADQQRAARRRVMRALRAPPP